MAILKTSYLSWLVLFLAIIAWGAVGFFAWSVSSESAQALDEGAVGEERTSAETSLRVHTLARETKGAREVLESLARTEVISVVEAIETIGRDTRSRIEVRDVLLGSPISPASPDAPVIQTLDIVVEGQGSFAALMQASALLFVFPIPSSVEEMHFEQVLQDGRSSGEWRLVARVRVLTIAEISS